MYPKHIPADMSPEGGTCAVFYIEGSGIQCIRSDIMYHQLGLWTGEKSEPRLRRRSEEEWRSLPSMHDQITAPMSITGAHRPPTDRPMCPLPPHWRLLENDAGGTDRRWSADLWRHCTTAAWERQTLCARDEVPPPSIHCPSSLLPSIQCPSSLLSSIQCQCFMVTWWPHYRDTRRHGGTAAICSDLYIYLQICHFWCKDA